MDSTGDHSAANPDREEDNTSQMTKWFDTFRRANKPSFESASIHRYGVYNERRAALHTANTSLARKLKTRHLHMIAIGGSIGTFWLPISR